MVWGKSHVVNSTPEWQDCIRTIIARPGVVTVIGASDAGKTTFCGELMNAAVEAELKAALVDADIGQSEIGPPGTIGLADVDQPVEKLSDLPVRRMHFVGATSPIGNMVQCVAGVRKMVDEATSRGASLITVDTTGLVRGVLARKLKTSKIDLLSPTHLVAIQKNHEVDPLIAAMAKIEKLTIHDLPISTYARPKSSELRAARRRLRFQKHFEHAESHVIRLEDVACWGTWFNTGRVLPWQRVRVIERILKARVMHAEATGRGFYIIAERPPAPGDVAALEEQARTKDITIVPAAAFGNVYVALADARANVLDVGIIQAVEFHQRYMSVITRLKSISPVRIVQFGLMRLKPDGVELGKLRPGEL